jgi:Enoyl-CoA hydratase/isomerase
MPNEPYACLRIRYNRGVAFVTIDHRVRPLAGHAVRRHRPGCARPAGGCLGHLPGGTGTQWLPRLIGRSRALEIILGREDFPAELAERYGYINRALPPDQLGPFVERLAYRIASFPAAAIALAKA